MSTKVGLLDLVRAAAAFCPDALTAISAHAEAPPAPQSPQRVLLTTRRLDTGGLQNVLVDQAARLTAAGHEVTIAVLETADSQLEVPDGVEVVELTNANTLRRVDEWVALCRERSIDIVIDHHILYNEHWPWRTLAAIAIGIPTIGWLHNFALRPLFDQSNRISFLDEHLQTLLSVVTLSPTDVVFWKLRGQNQAVHLPNPPSPLAISALAGDLQPRRLAGRLELAWWGRLNATTKQVQHLVDIAAELRAREIDFRLTIVGPGSKDLSAMDVRRYAQQRGVGDAVELLGELNASELQRAVADAHLLVSTSAIEGYQLTLVEAQAMGMPVAMYDLPWLATVRGNPAVLTSQPDDPAALADLIAGLARDPERYAQLSQHAREHAQRIADVDLGLLLEQLVAGALPAEYSPAPSLAEASLLLDWSVRIGERNVKTAAAELAGTDADALRRDRDLARAQLRQITEGPSFRIGRAITKLPRRVRDLVRPAKKSSLFAGTATVVRAAVSAPPPPLRANPSIPTPGRATVPDVSFVIPVYNAEAWLEDCVTSVLAQTGIDVEVICIDDGSTDGSGRILSRLADADPRVTVIEQANSGQSVGRNRGLDAAAGRYLIYLDSDDYWPGDVAKRLVRSADESDLDLLLFDCIAFRDGDIDDKVWKRYSTYYQRAHTYREVRSGVQLMADMRRSKDYRPHVGLYMARTSFVRTQGVRFIPGIVHQDNPYTFRLMLHASRAAHESIDAYARRMRPGSTITTLNAERSARGYYLSYLEMTREMKNHRLPAQVTDPVNNIVDYVYDGARKQFALLDPAALDELRSLDLSDDAQRIFASLLESSRDA
nr:glycosyltransferase [Microbacterium esteraromaticum]